MEMKGNDILDIDFLFNLDKVRYEKLRKANDIEGECLFQSDLIASKGNLILETLKTSDRIIIVYRTLFGSEDIQEEPSIFLSLRIITKKGLVYPEPKLLATMSKNEIHIGDIRIFDENINKGYGSILVNHLIKIALENNVTKIHGFISQVDIDHYDRLIHFYTKNGFVFENKSSFSWKKPN